MTATVRPRLHLHLPLQLFWMAAYLICSSILTETLGVEPREYAIEVSVEVLSSPFALKLTWEPTGASRTYTIRRRPFGSSEWSTRATLPAGSSQFVDTSVSGGAAYEYEIQLETTYRGAGGWINAYGYVLAGGNVSWPDQKGKVLLVVDATAAASLENEIGTFQRDLIGAGWNPIRRDIARASSVPEVKNLIRAEYNADPSNLRAVILLGHVPVPYSGNIAPDLHESHRGAWPADVYYAEMDGNWTDDTVNIASGDYVANDNRPGDGKFDQSQTPSTVELELGRIDFYDLPSFAGKTQVDLLRNYLKKNTEFRNRAFTAARRMLVRDNFGDLSEDAPAVDAWRHYRQFFGAGNVRSVGPGDFFWTLQNESFLWSYGCGGGGNTKADGVGTTTDFTTQSPQSVFMILHGSYFGDWNTKDNFLRGALGSQGYTLASIWSGLPHWYMHPMGLGRSIGFCTRLTQNNVNDYKSHLNYSSQQVHISLMGDPTLESFPVIPPRNLSGTASSTVNLNWAASTESSIIGYHVYYATSAAGAYQRLTTSAVGGTSYSHSVGTGTHHYMLRAVKLERTGSGTYLNFSQGVFTSVTKSTGGTLPTVNVTAVDPDAGEGGSSGAIRFSRSPTDGNAVTVDFVVGGTAQNGIDYNQIGSSVVIPAWSAQQEIMINPSTDNEVEEEETLTIQLRPASSYNIGSPASAVVRIADLVNRPPTISTVADQTIEAGASSSNLVFQVSDPETAAGTLTVRAESSNTQIIPQGSITLSGTGANRTVRVATAAGKTGVATIRLIVSDGVNESSSIFSVTVITPNLKPTALPQIVETWENSPVEIVLNGTDPENQPLSFAIKVSPVNGTLSGLPPNVTYTPRTNYVGTDVFSFTVNDGKTESSPAEVGLTVSARNKPPLAIPQSLEMLEDTVLRIQLSGTDPEQDPLTFEIVQQPTNGVLSNIGTNYFYLPNTNVVGSDFFTFRVLDSELVSEPAVVAIEITNTNDAPSATNLTVELDEDTTVEFRLNGLDPDGDALNYVLMRMPTNGVISGVPPDLIYRPVTNFYGADELTYYVSDDVENGEPTTIQFLVKPVNDAPTAGSQVLSTDEDTVLPIQLAGTDVESDLLSFRVLENPTSGQLLGTIDSLQYIPGTNFNGDDVFTFVANDGVRDSLPATVRISVIPKNDIPTIGNVPAKTARKNSFVGPFELAVSDADRAINQLLVWAESTNSDLITTNGIVIVHTITNQQVTLRPNEGAVGESIVTIKVSDGEAIVETSFMLTVVNTPPLPQDDDLNIPIGTNVLSWSQLLANDGDQDGDQLKIVWVSDRSEAGLLVMLSSNVVTYLGGSYSMNDTFSYVVEDSSGGRGIAQVRLSVSAAPRIQSVIKTEGGVRLRFRGEPNRVYRVLWSNNGQLWGPAAQGTADAEGFGEFTDSDSALPRCRWYRIEWLSN